jgi:hypothetical protein
MVLRNIGIAPSGRERVHFDEDFSGRIAWTFPPERSVIARRKQTAGSRH